MTLDELNRCDRGGFVRALGGIFEDSPWVAEGAFERRPFRDPRHLHAEMSGVVRRAPPSRQLALIRAHPDLAGRLAAAGRLTEASRREQASAGLDRMEAAERAEFEGLNQAYRNRFGFPFVICARLNQREAIKGAMRRRTGNAPEEERETALAEIDKIAWLRLEDLFKG